MSLGAWVLITAVALSLAFGLHRGRTDGRFRGTRRTSVAGAAEVAEVAEAGGAPAPDGAETPAPAQGPWSAIADAVPAAELGERATLVQFSSAFCAPCRVTRRILGDVAQVVPGVTHVEIDAEQHLDLVRRLGVARTPTTLVLDSAGREVTRAAGAPRTDQVLAALPAS